MKIITLQTVLLLFLLTATVPAFCGNKTKYPVSSIPKELLHNAKAVLRFKTVVYERTGLGSARQHLTYAVTVLNKGDSGMDYFFQFYNKFSHIGTISATVYNEYGKKVKKIKKIKKENFLDAVSDFGKSLYTDTRLKIIKPEYDSYPFTVEYSCIIDYHGTMEIPSWQIYPHYDMSIEKESFTMITPDVTTHPNQGIFYYANDSSLQLYKKTAKGKIFYTLQVENLPPVDKEIFSPLLINRSPTLFFAPVAFSIGKYDGCFVNWDAFGNFINRLNKGRDELPKETQAKLQEMVAGKTNRREIVKTLYRYMQDKVRYVSVQKGIGGWQPFAAEKVDKLSYGDCKALTNYMKSLLKAVDIPAKYTLVRAGEKAPPMKTDFLSNQFNHAILCVPLSGDTLWLECTNQHIPCGYIGDFTDDRNVLVIDDSAGATIAHTKAYGKDENIRCRHTDVQFVKDGSCSVNIRSDHRGLFYDRQLPLSLTTHNRQKKEILNNLHFPTVLLKNFSFTEKKATPPSIRLSIDLALPKYAVNMGNRLLFYLYPFSKGNDMVFRHKKRHAPLLIRRNYTTINTLVYHLPKGYVPASLPKQQTVSSSFGNGSFQIEQLPEKIVYIRRIEINKGDYPPSDYKQFMSFFNKIKSIDTKKVLI